MEDIIRASKESKLFIIMRGVPGSGKSTLAQQIIRLGLWEDIAYHSTDNYWIRPDGHYDFNINRLGAAHEWNFSQFEISLCEERDLIVLDNTNTQYNEFGKYVRKMSEFDNYKVMLVEPDTSWKFDAQECFKRNTHNVPLATIEKMIKRWTPTEECERLIEEQVGEHLICRGYNAT